MKTLPPDASIPEHLRQWLGKRIPKSARIVVGTSGGPDSQAMLDILARLRHELQIEALWALGVDHQIRPEARQELEFAAQLAQQHGIHFHIVEVNVAPVGNVLANARKARYRAYRAFAAQVGANLIATGHTATDQVETLLMRLCRGTGLRGASGIAARRGLLLRPILCLERAFILAYLEQHRIDFATDPSNTHPKRARAKIRASILPALASLNPRYAEQMSAFCEAARQDEKLLAKRAHRHLQQCLGHLGSLRLQQLMQLSAPARRRVILAWLEHLNVPRSAQSQHHLETWLHQKPRPHSVQLSGLVVECQHGRLWPNKSRLQAPLRSYTSATDIAPKPRQITLPGTTLGSGFQIEASLHVLESGQARHWIAKQFPRRAKPCDWVVAFDADRLHFDLTLRPWVPGDRCRALGLSGHIKVGDLLTNSKIPRMMRPHWPLVTCGNDVVWVVGLRRGEQALVTETTRRIVLLKVEGFAEPWEHGRHKVA